MKKNIDIKNLAFLFGILMVGATLFWACDDDKNGNTIRIDSVWTNVQSSDTKQITSSNVDSWVRLEGVGFNGLLDIYCNGTKVGFNPAFVTDNNIIFKIPKEGIPVAGEVEDIEIRNTIRVVTPSGQAVYRDFEFIDPQKEPGITGVSSTMPYPGDIIEIRGRNLKLADKVRFPTGQEGTIINIIDTVIKVQVPALIDRTYSGPMYVHFAGDADGRYLLSAPYMYYNEGIFMNATTDPDIQPSGLLGTSFKNYSGDDVKTYTGLENNPETVIAIPDIAKDIAIGANNDDKNSTGWFRFSIVKGIQKVINSSNNKITGETDMNSCAIQFEFYMNQPWITGALSYRLIGSQGGRASRNTTNFGWWTSIKGGKYVFNDQWQTVTIPLSEFKATNEGLPLGTFDSYLNIEENVNSSGAIFAYVNYLEGYPSVPLTNFQLFIANMRIVPTSSSLATNIGIQQ